MVIITFERIFCEIGILLNDKEKNAELLKKASDTLKESKRLIDLLDTKKIIKKINESTSVGEKKQLKKILEEQQVFQKNADLIDEIINGNYDNVKPIHIEENEFNKESVSDFREDVLKQKFEDEKTDKKRGL